MDPSFNFCPISCFCVKLCTFLFSDLGRRCLAISPRSSRGIFGHRTYPYVYSYKMFAKSCCEEKMIVCEKTLGTFFILLYRSNFVAWHLVCHNLTVGQPAITCSLKQFTFQTEHQKSATILNSMIACTR